MQRAEAEEQILKTISNMNSYGLEIVCRIIERMDTIDAYNINTTPERVTESRELREQEEAERKTQEEELQVKYLMERMKLQIDRRNAAIASLTGKEKKFWEKIEKVQSMDIGRYEMYTWQIKLISNLHSNNYIEASHAQFSYGFHQGMQYTKNKARKCHRKAVQG